MCIEWKDGTTTWERLATLKESNPVEVAEYAMAVGIDDKPAFKWWVPHTIRKRNVIIAKVNSRFLKRTHKFGFEVPRTIKDAYRLDKENGNDRWHQAMGKETSKIRVALKILEDSETPPIESSDYGNNASASIHE